MTQAHLIADSLVTLAAIVGLLVLFGVLRRSGPADALTGRFQLGLIVLIVLLTGRLLWWITENSLFLPVMYISAGLIPLAAVVLAEGLLRRHAPPLVKYGLLAGTALFTVLAFLPIALVEPFRSYGLLAFQFAGFLAAGWMVVTRDRASLSPRENWLTDRIALSLLLILPFLVTDFRFDGSQLPVRMAGIAILFICWLVVGAGRSSLGHRDTVKAFAVLVVSAVIGGIGIGAIAGLDFAGMVQSVALALCAALVAAIFIDAMNLGAEERRDSLLTHIAYGSETDAAAFLSGLREHMLVEGALMLEPSDLSEFDTAELETVFAADPVRHVGEIRKQTPKQPGIEQLQAIFERYEVTHLMLVSREPLTLVALNMPALAATPGAETELRAVQRVALLISERGHDRH
ncbi:hypothetical protein [Mesorhizobium sp. CAU 1732]|uniref:hypothetical protein n=1 Tax=Mesorhizobium sp. CAU 1732 TaxID=3140358 RepID=UPI003260A4D7